MVTYFSTLKRKILEARHKQSGISVFENSTLIYNPENAHNRHLLY